MPEQGTQRGGPQSWPGCVPPAPRPKRQRGAPNDRRDRRACVWQLEVAARRGSRSAAAAMRLTRCLLIGLVAAARAQSDESDTDAAAAGSGAGGSADSSGGAAPVTTGPAPVNIYGPWRGPVAAAPPAVVTTGSSDAAPVVAAPAGVEPPPAAASAYVWKMAAPGASAAAAAALNAALLSTPHAPPSWMLKKWPPRPPSPPAPNAPPPPNYLSFIGIADWGGETQWPPTTAAQLQCAAAMPAVIHNQAVSMILSAGDNFYDDGISGASGRALSLVSRAARASPDRRAGPIDGPVAIARYNQTWATPYDVATLQARGKRRKRERSRPLRPNQCMESLTADALALVSPQIPWYVVAGNHDWEGNVSGAHAARCACSAHAQTDAPAVPLTCTRGRSQPRLRRPPCTRCGTCRRCTTRSRS